jgi:hypothetical protein
MAVNKVLMERWAHASRHLRSDEADQLWQEITAEWLKPLIADQRYWNSLLQRKMSVLERREQRRAISDDEWDKRHEDVNR